MRNLLWSGFLIMMVLSGCGWDGTPTRPNDFTKLTSLEIVANSPTIAALTSTKLTVKGNFSGIFTRDITDQVTWSTDSPTVAGFTNTAIPNAVTGHIPGTAVLTATVGNISNTFSLTVSNATVTALAITPATPSVPKGLTQQFAVTGTFSDLSTQDVTLDATWASSITTVATVSDAAGSKGLAQSLAIGSTQISATFGGISDTTSMTVTAPVLQSIAVSTTTPSLLSLTSGTFQASGVYSDGTSVDVTSQVAWSSGNTSIATITATGTATALSEGTTSIIATLGTITGSTSLKVTGGHLTGITASPATTTMIKGTSSALTATGKFSNGTSRDITGIVAWSVANTNIATVTSPAGNLIWLNTSSTTSGTTTVTASYSTLSSTIDLTVTNLGVASIAISSGTMDLTVGTTARLNVMATLTDNTTQDVTANSTWASSDANIASVDNTLSATIGRVNGVAAGSATITATYGGLHVTSLVTVKTRTVQSLAINAINTTTTVPGGQLPMRATATYTDGTTQDVTENATWSIDTPSVAILTTSSYQTGSNAPLPMLVMGVGTGTATLSATFGGKTQTTTITVQ